MERHIGTFRDVDPRNTIRDLDCTYSSVVKRRLRAESGGVEPCDWKSPTGKRVTEDVQENIVMMV